MGVGSGMRGGTEMVVVVGLVLGVSWHVTYMKYEWMYMK
jgi:hypothetical protein